MDAEKLPRLTGLFERSGVFHLRVMIPKDLQAAHNGRSKLVQSLKTSDRKAAELVALKVRADALLGFEEMRRNLNPSPVAVITPELSRLLADRVHARFLAVDATMRAQPEALDALVAVIDAAAPSGLVLTGTRPARPRAIPADPLEGLTDAQADKLATLNRGLDLHSAQVMARQKLSAVLPHLQHEAQQLGLSFDSGAEGAREALQETAAALRRAAIAVTARDRGDVVPTPKEAVNALPVAPVPPAVEVVSLRAVYARWKASKARSEDSNSACLRALLLLEGQMPEACADVTKITRSNGDSFRAWLQQQGTSSKTARDRFNWLKTLLKYACRDLELITRQPWEGLELAFRTENPRRPFTPDELQRLFSLPLFTRYELPTAWNAGADAAYWVPLLGLFLGARPGELCQLAARDVDLDGVFPIFKIRDDGEDQSVKTAAGIRSVPIHSELIRLGFLEYAQKIQKKDPAGPLWPSLKKRKGKASGYFSRWFHEMTRAQLVSFGELPDFYCLRHTVRTAMAEAGIQESIQDRITGHAVTGSTGTKTYSHPVQILRTAVESVQFPGLELPRCYPG